MASLILRHMMEQPTILGLSPFAHFLANRPATQPTPPPFSVLTPLYGAALIASLQPGDGGMPQKPDIPATSVLLIDANDTDRIRFAAYLKNCSPDYTIFEAVAGHSGLNLYRSRRIDCVVLSLDLPDYAGFRALSNLVPIASKPNVAVIALTERTMRGIHEIAIKNGAY